MRLRLRRALEVEGKLRAAGDVIDVTDARLIDNLLSFRDATPAELPSWYAPSPRVSWLTSWRERH